MKPVILAEKPSQAKAYSDAFTTYKRDGYIEINPCPIFPQGAYLTWGVGHLVELKEPHAYNHSCETLDTRQPAYFARTL
ncbi:hypothetical protein [Sporosarcina obsidiansis]|uniref:hypothetical protein n=1 Tax=Sporosarcina obsidiansis TaxID=2660748 RepID=UPI00129A88E7|nr:hypothetical protein [Sporosarcina obsidiansis]